MAIQQYALALIGATDAWDQVNVSKDIKIAVFDTGIDRDHPDLDGVVIKRYNAWKDRVDEPRDDEWHGTQCAGLIAGKPGGGLGISGVGKGCSLLDVRVVKEDDGRPPKIVGYRDFNEAIDWCVGEGADILSLSLQGRLTKKIRRKLMQVGAVNKSTSGRGGKGCVIVIAAGNGNDEFNMEHGDDFPEHAIVVSASDQQNRPKFKEHGNPQDWGTNYGSEVDVAAPGIDLYTTDLTGNKGWNKGGKLDSDQDTVHDHYRHNFWGTSAATALVSGAVGLMLSKNQQLNAEEVRNIVKSTSVDLQLAGVPNSHRYSGIGRIDVLGAVRSA